MLNCGVKVTVVTLDATHSSWFGYEEVNELRRIGTKEAEFAAQMLYHRIYAANLIGARAEKKSALHDVLAVCAAIDRRFSPTCAMSPATWTSGAISRTVR